MRMRVTTILTFAAALTMAVTAEAQGPRGRGLGMMGGGGYMLLGNKSVQQELKLSDEQAEKATKLINDVQAKTREKMEGLSQEERREKGREIFEAANEEAKSGAKDILKPEQTARLDQISLQARGLQAFTDSKIQEKLKLTDDQKSKLKDIEEDVRSQSRELFQGFQNDREGTMQKFAALRKESLGKAVALLTDEQKATWKEMTGEPFEVKFERRPGGGA